MIILYSTGCAKCKVIETKLNQLQVPFELVTDVDKVVEVGHSCGINTAPILKVDDTYYDFTQAIKFIKEQG